VYIAESQMLTTKAPAGPRKELRRHDFTSKPQGCALGSSSPGDRLLTPEQEPPLGAHLVTPRFAYQHHGVYVGRGVVVHYAAYAKHWRRGPVEEISLARFADGHPVWVRPPRRTWLQRAEIVGRARSRLGENRYRFFSNNCEHLSEWCVNGEHRSLQVEHLLAPLRRVSGALGALKPLLARLPRRRGRPESRPAASVSRMMAYSCALDLPAAQSGLR
jgi:Lecithin retinol acyltransferase